MEKIRKLEGLIICFDADGTLFDEFLGVREGLEDALKELNDRGAKLVVTTTAKQGHVESNLSEEILNYIDKIYTESHISPEREKTNGKYYQRVCEDYSAKPEQLLIIGDIFNVDYPRDIEAVLIIDRTFCPADVLVEIIGKLWNGKSKSVEDRELKLENYHLKKANYYTHEKVIYQKVYDLDEV